MRDYVESKDGQKDIAKQHAERLWVQTAEKRHQRSGWAGLQPFGT